MGQIPPSDGNSSSASQDIPRISRYPKVHRGALWYRWLRHCAKSRKSRGVHFPMGRHYGTGVDPISNISEYQGYFLGGKGGPNRNSDKNKKMELDRTHIT